MPPLDPDALAGVVVMTLKTALAPLQADVKALQGQIATWESRWSDVTALRERTAVLEAKAAEPQQPIDVAPLEHRIGAAEALLHLTMGEHAPLVASLTDLTQEHAAVRERLTLVELKAAQGGPQGTEGRPGRDGRDGLGFGDLSVAQDGERSFLVRAAEGERVKDLGRVTFPVDIYRGVWVEGKTYDRGDGATWAGSEWHCNDTTTTKPGDGSKAWTLKVKRGRDGKDGQDAPSLPVVKVGR